LKRFELMSNTKLAFLTKYPNAINFLGTIFYKHFDQLDEKLQSRIEALWESTHAKIYSNLDYSMFRDDIDHEKAIKLVLWTFQGYEQELTNRLQDQDMSSINFEPYFDEFIDYLHIMKTCFYKK